MASNRDTGPHIGSYRDAATHKNMLQDVVRTTSYYEAIRAAVRTGDHVIDFGSGTGVLAIFAARQGAGKVDAIERTAMVTKAREIARLSGCPDIRFHDADEDCFETDGKADLLISEWMGHFVFCESMMEPLIAVRDKWLKKGGRMLPESLSLHAALVIDPMYHEDDAFLEGSPYGIDFGPIADLPLRQSRLVDVGEDHILPTICALNTLDMMTITRTPSVLTGDLTVDREAVAFGLVGWFDAQLYGDVRFGTGPYDPQTHWRQLYFPFPHPFEVSPSRPLAISFRPPREVDWFEPTWAWSISDGTTTIAVDEVDTFTRSGTLHNLPPRQ